MICEVELFNVIFPEVIVVLDKVHPPTVPAVLLALLAALAAADAVVLLSAVVWAFDAAVAALLAAVAALLAAVAALLAVASFVKPLLLFKVDMFIPAILIRAAATVPVVIRAPSITVVSFAIAVATCEAV